MAARAPSALSVAPLNAPNKDLESFPLADRDYLIEDFLGNRDFLQTFRQLRDDYLNGHDTYGIWESNLPYYCLPSVNIFPEIIRLCAENYDVQHRAIKSPSGSILFHINPETINKMLHF